MTNDQINKKIAEIPIRGKNGKGKFAIIDIEDYPIVSLFGWYLGNKNNCLTYINVNGKYSNMQMHRLIINAKEGEITDHVNHNPLDNRKCNLRICTNQQNGMNSKSSKNSTSKYKGVSWVKAVNKWQAAIKFNGKSIFLGYSKDEEEAAISYNEKAEELFGEYAYYNNVGMLPQRS